MTGFNVFTQSGRRSILQKGELLFSFQEIILAYESRIRRLFGGYCDSKTDREVMTNLADLKKTLKSHRNELNRKYGVTSLGIFGSFVKNKQNMSSDVDILVEFNEAIDLFTFLKLKNHLSDLLKVNVDLVMKKALKPKIGQRILQEVVDI